MTKSELIAFQNGLILGHTLLGLPVYVTVQDNVVLSYRALDVLNYNKNKILKDGLEYARRESPVPYVSDVMQIHNQGLSDNATVEIL